MSDSAENAETCAKVGTDSATPGTKSVLEPALSGEASGVGNDPGPGVAEHHSPRRIYGALARAEAMRAGHPEWWLLTSWPEADEAADLARDVVALQAEVVRLREALEGLAAADVVAGLLEDRMDYDGAHSVRGDAIAAALKEDA